jgi:hypothetical protein
MKTFLISFLSYLWLISLALSQAVKDPLRDYYVRNFAAIKLPTSLDPESPSGPLTLQSKVYYFKADFTGDGRKSVFITDDAEYLGVHGKYAWSVYFPTARGGYRLITNDYNFIVGGILGPDYIGYVKEAKRYGVLTASKDSVGIYYLSKGALKSDAVDTEHGRDWYPQYFSNDSGNYNIITYTLAELSKKYGRPDSAASVSPVSK